MSLMQSSGTITLQQIRNNWVSSGVTGYYSLVPYRGQPYTTSGAYVQAGTMPLNPITIQNFYGKGPYIDPGSPAPPPTPPYVPPGK